AERMARTAPPSAPVGATLSNRWTGKPRDYRDVDSDPEGVLCVDPGAPLKAAAEVEGLTTKQAWWAGYRAGKGLPADTPRQEALAQQPAAVDGRIAIEPGERLFQFDSKQEWINHASRIWRFHGVRSEDTVCVDALGRLVNIGKHFADAERDRAYPIVVYRLRADMNRNTGAAQQQGGA